MEFLKTGIAKNNNPRSLAIIQKKLKQGKRYFGSSGASLTHQAFNPKYEVEGLDRTLTKIGLDGERATTKILKEWIKDKDNVILIDSVHIPGIGKEEISPDEDGIVDAGDTDHVMIIGNNVILLDSKAWKNKTSYLVDEDGEILRAKKRFPGGQVRMKNAYYLWKNYLDNFDELNLFSYIVITNEETFIQRDRNWWRQPFKLINHENIVDNKEKDIDGWLDKLYNEDITQKDKEFINVDLVAQILIGCVKPYDVYKEKLGRISNLMEI